jgi:hypothetical protein
MNREFKLKYDTLRENDPTKPKSSETFGENLYYEEGRSRSICFVWLDGRRFFLSYSYLLAGDYKLEGEKNQINLVFTSHTVILQGYLLEQLFMALFEHLPKVIFEMDKRYILNKGDSPIVTDILIEKRED